eukprot:gene1100-biopygen22748
MHSRFHASVGTPRAGWSARAGSLSRSGQHASHGRASAGAGRREAIRGAGRGPRTISPRGTTCSASTGLGSATRARTRRPAAQRVASPHLARPAGSGRRLRHQSVALAQWSRSRRSDLLHHVSASRGASSARRASRVELSPDPDPDPGPAAAAAAPPLFAAVATEGFTTGSAGDHRLQLLEALQIHEKGSCPQGAGGCKDPESPDFSGDWWRRMGWHGMARILTESHRVPQNVTESRGV